MTPSSQDLAEQLRAVLGDAFTIERELTGGGMSRVFVAVERDLHRSVVVKVLPPELAAGVNRERFRREIQLAARLQHPHIVPLHTAGAGADLLYFTMPYIEGESLRHALAAGHRFSSREVVRILRDVADAIAYAHARGVIHRDIKPGNVLRNGPHALVTDFGVAKAISAAQPAPGMTTSGMVIGSPQYMAPEQLSGDPAADHRVDIYAVGLLGYELLAGKLPFAGATPQETLAAQLTHVPEPIAKKRPDVPVALSSLLSRCLAKSPADRPQQAAEVVAALEGIDIWTGSNRALPASRPVGRLVIGAVVVVSGLALAMYLRQERAPAAPPSSAVTGPGAGGVVAAAGTLTRDDSLAIARAIEEKFDQQRNAARARSDSAERAAQARSTADSVRAQQYVALQFARMADSLRSEIQRAVLDSVARVRGPGADLRALRRGFPALDSAARAAVASLRDGGGTASLRAPGDPRAGEPPMPPAPPRRLLLLPPDLRGPASPVAPAADSLVTRLRAELSRSPRFIVVDADSTRLALARSRAVSEVSRRLAADVVASLGAHVRPDGSVLWEFTARDLSAVPSQAVRTFVHQAPAGRPLDRAEALITTAVRFLRDMDRAPRREGPTGPPRP